MPSALKQVGRHEMTKAENQNFDIAVKHFIVKIGQLPPTSKYDLHPAHKMLAEYLENEWRHLKILHYRPSKKIISDNANAEASHILRGLYLNENRELTASGATYGELLSDYNDLMAYRATQFSDMKKCGNSFEAARLAKPNRNLVVTETIVKLLAPNPPANPDLLAAYNMIRNSYSPSLDDLVSDILWS